ncbi:MAG: lysozyme [Cetobacterium sp.]
MKISQKGIELIKKFEGCKLEAYRCPAGVWTIGYGHTKTAKQGMKITQQQAEELLKQDLCIYESSVERNIKVAINQPIFDALVSFTYNLGEGNLKSSTLLKKLNNRDYYGASEEFQRWNKAGGKVLNGLIKRREAERNLFNSYPA